MAGTVSCNYLGFTVSIHMVSHFAKELTGTFQLALLFMKVVDCILTCQNDTFGNIAVYYISIT